MPEPKFTPGPWGISRQGNIIRGQREEFVCGLNGVVGHDANLIVKAPEMAALIADIEEAFTADDSYALLRGACRKILREIGSGQ